MPNGDIVLTTKECGAIDKLLECAVSIPIIALVILACRESGHDVERVSTEMVHIRTAIMARKKYG